MSESPISQQKASGRNKALILIVSAALVLILAGLWWWHSRPIRPVQLSAQELAVVEQKVAAIQPAADSAESDATGETSSSGVPAAEEPVYEKGGKEIVLTEREINGLLNHNTSLGESLKFELATNAIHARIETDLDPDLPLIGGKRLKARARFVIGEGPGEPALVLDDVTLWGVSLPNAWLGGLKGQDLLGMALGTGGGGLRGVEEFKVERGQITIRLAE